MTVPMKAAAPLPYVGDLEKMRGKRAPTLEKEKARLRKATREFESFFTYQMLKSMRKTIPESPMSKKTALNGSSGKDMFTDMFDMEVSRQMAQDRPGSIADLMYRSMEKLVEAPYLRDSIGDKTLTPAHLPIHPVREAAPMKSLRMRPIEKPQEMLPIQNPRPPLQSPLAGGRFQLFIQEASDAYNLDSALLRSVIMAESAGQPRAVSSQGAKGLMQLIDSTAAEMGVKDAFDPKQNIRGGSRYLRKMLDEFGDLPLALAAYNAGPANVRRYQGIPPFKETQEYVERVMRFYLKDRTDEKKFDAKVRE